jgi:hypothetical protein
VEETLLPLVKQGRLLDEWSATPKLFSERPAFIAVRISPDKS